MIKKCEGIYLYKIFLRKKNFKRARNRIEVFFCYLRMYPVSFDAHLALSAGAPAVWLDRGVFSSMERTIGASSAAREPPLPFFDSNVMQEWRLLNCAFRRPWAFNSSTALFCLGSRRLQKRIVNFRGIFLVSHCVYPIRFRLIEQLMALHICGDVSSIKNRLAHADTTFQICCRSRTAPPPVKGVAFSAFSSSVAHRRTEAGH